MHFNPWTFLFEMLNFVVLAVVLYRLLYRPLHAAIDRRREDVTRAQTEADKAREQAVTLQQQLQAQLAEVERQGEEALRQGREAPKPSARKCSMKPRRRYNAGMSKCGRRSNGSARRHGGACAGR